MLGLQLRVCDPVPSRPVPSGHAMSAPIPDITEAKLEGVDTLLHRRCGAPTPIELADAGIAR